MYLETIQPKVKKIIATYLKISEQEISDNSTLNDLDADIFNKIDIFFEIDRTFQITIETDNPIILYNSSFMCICKEVETAVAQCRNI